MNKNPTITVAVPTYNRLELLKRTMESILAQEVPPDEILVIDDKSSDAGVIDYLKTLKEIRLILNKKNLGSFENINKCIRVARGDYVIVVQSDDLVLPNCVKIYKEAMEKYERKPAVYFSGGYIIDENDKVHGLVRPLKGNQFLTPPHSLKYFWNNYWFNILVGGWSCYRRDIFKKVGYFTREYGRAGENEMTMKIVPNSPIYYIDKPLFAYRKHSQQALEGEKQKQKGSSKIELAREGIRALYDYENHPEVMQAFKKNEINQRIFIRRPITFFLVISFNYLLTGRFRESKAFLRIFKRAYPSPFLSQNTMKLVMGWLIKLAKDYITNLIIRMRFGKRSVIEVV